MKKGDKQRQKLILEAGGRFLRHAKHGPLYRLPNGAIVGTSGSSSDQRSLKNLQSQLKKALSRRSHSQQVCP